ncbi:MAG: hypothetical protein SGILL_000461 [Bacillariaceae sp.]
MVENKASFEEDDNRAQDTPIYLNNAGKAILDPEVVDVGHSMVNQPPFVHPPPDLQDRIRSLFSQLIHADPDEIAIVPSTAFAITMAAKNIQRLHLRHVQQIQQDQASCTNTNTKLRTKILLLQDQMCSAVYPWQQICDESRIDDRTSANPLSLHVVPSPKEQSGGWTEAILSELSMQADQILVACLPPLHWSDGSLVNLNDIAPICHNNDIVLVLDATQAVGVMPLDVHKMRPAMLACSIHKWLRGPSGASLVYIDRQLHEAWEPLDQHGRSRDMKYAAAWEAYPNQMTPDGYNEIFCHGARKFDSGGKPNSIILPMLQKSLEQVVERVDLDACQSELEGIVEPFLKWLRRNTDMFILPPGPHVFHLMGIRPTGQWLNVPQMLEIVQKMENERIYLAVRCGAFRVAPYLNSTRAEMKRFVSVFEKVVQSYASSNLSTPLPA